MPGAPHIGDSGSTTIFRWEILIPTQRYVFTVNSGRLEEYNREGELSFHRFSRYQSLKADHPVHGMVAWPNTVLLSGPATVVVDPGLVMQGEPLLAALAERGLSAGDVDLVVNTHAHMDHVQANVYFPGTPIVIHEAEFGGSPAHERSGFDGRARLLSGDEGEIAPGLRFLRTPGHSEGSICVVAETAAGRLVIAGDTVGPLPSYFTSMELPAGFPAADRLLQSWHRIRELDPVVVIPGHNPPMRARISG